MVRCDPRAAILDLLRQHGGEPLSGEEISRVIGVSRTAIWKQINTLRELGYAIEAVTSRGYRLLAVPDSLLASEIESGLATKIIGRPVVALGETDSTNARAGDLAEHGAPEGTVVIAEGQSQGKGRMGRRWESPVGVNLYASVLLRPPIPPYEAPQLTFLSAVAVARVVALATGLTPEVKWPNDVLLGGRKVAGLLNEMRAETEGVHHVILGIGVNLNMSAAQFPEDLRYPATSLQLELGRPVSRLAFTRDLLRELDRLYSEFLLVGFGPVRMAWEGFCRLVGQTVEVDFQDRQIQGTVLGIDADGALLLRHPGGTRERVLAGDVRPVGGSRP